MFDAKAIIELLREGATPAEVLSLVEASPEAASTVAAPPKAGNSFYENVIVGKRADRQARRALAADMRARGVQPNGPAWKKAKKAAGIA